MTTALIRILFAGGFATVALVGALVLEIMGNECPAWLVGVIGAAVGFMFAHAEANGTNLWHKSSQPG